jgi:FMN phosphatase YigB (HAD superfamily)
MKTNDPLIVWDIDNTLLTNWEGWDRAFAGFGLYLTGMQFSMTKRSDSTFDSEFSKKTPWQLFQERLAEIGFSQNGLTEKDFYQALGVQYAHPDCQGCVKPFVGVRDFVRGVGRVTDRAMWVITGGPRQMQIRVLGEAGLLDRFDIKGSTFGGEFKTKRHALEQMAEVEEPASLVYVGDSPSDMHALCTTACGLPRARKLAVGVTIAGLSTTEELRSAGANIVVDRFDPQTIGEIQSLISS